jgi:predicted nucleotide-binding protein
MKILYHAVVSTLDELEARIAVYLNARETFLAQAASLGPDREQEHSLSKKRLSRSEVETVETYVLSFCKEKDRDLKYWKPVRDFLDEGGEKLYSETQRLTDNYLDAEEVAQVQIWIRVTRFYIDVANKSEDNYTGKKTDLASLSSSGEVFIVHGHDELTKLQVARFVEAELRYKCVILHESPNISRNVLSKFLEESRNAIFAIVLMTPDDVGGVAATKLKKRARQNVIFELGFFIGKFGADRVAALIKGNLEKPSDFDGIGYINLDPNGGWKWKLAGEIAQAVKTRPALEGYFINEATPTRELPHH